MTDELSVVPTGSLGSIGFDQVTPLLDQVNDWLPSAVKTPVATYIVPFQVIVLPDGLISSPGNDKFAGIDGNSHVIPLTDLEKMPIRCIIVTIIPLLSVNELAISQEPIAIHELPSHTISLTLFKINEYADSYAVI
jgi:hypothetical protein